MIYAEGFVPRLDTVQLDTAHGPEFLHAETRLGSYRSLLDQMEAVSLSEDESRDFVCEVAEQA